MRTLLALSLLAASLTGCGDDATPPDAGPDATTDSGTDAGLNIVADRPECENLNPVNCLVPYPSSRYLVDDPAMATGRRVDYPMEALPLNKLDEPVVKTTPWNGRFDGFSPMTSMLTAFPGKIDTGDLPDEEHIDLSVTVDSPTILLDAETGELVGHFSEVNQWPNADTDRDSFYIRPAVRMKEDHRYIVAIRDLHYMDSSPVEPSDYFRALRDDIPTDVDELEARRPLFEDIFTLLETAGVPRDNLIEAWDFHTATGENAWGEVVRVRDDALMRVGDRGIACTVDRVDVDVNDETWERITGTFTVPLYMESQYEGTIAHRDGDGNIAFNGMVEAGFTFVIPYSVRDRIMSGGTGERILMYGHGLLGESEQVNSRGTRTLLQRFGIVGVGTDYWGLAHPDEANFVTYVMTQFGNFDMLGERLIQGTINSIVLARSFRGVCSELPEFQVDGTPVYDPDQMYYYGISQGGLMGATVAALSPDIERFALQVGAVDYPMLMRRSSDFDHFESVFDLWYLDMVDRDWLILSTQNMWDYTDPATYVSHLLHDPLPGTPVKRILYQISRYDTQVANPASDISARTMGLPWFRSSVYEPWNVGPGTDGPEDSGYIIYHLDDVAPIAIGSRPTIPDNNAHEDLRLMDAVQTQIDTFMQPDGQVVDTCPMGSCELHNTVMH